MGILSNPVYEAAVFDLDKTIISTKTSESIALGILSKEIQKRHYANVAKGIWGAVLATAYDKLGSEQRGLEAFISAINSARCANDREAYAFAEDCINRSLLPGVKELVETLRGYDMPVIIFTGGLDVSAQAAANILNADSWGSCYAMDGHIIQPSRYVGTAKPNKHVALRTYLKQAGYPIENCIVFGDSETDLEAFAESGYAVASPKATGRAKKAANLWVPNYRELCNAIPPRQNDTLSVPNNVDLYEPIP
ncbi:MAG: haloacid dehalogenase-like hydrolase [Candidatus Aenigmarchaeota archaeon]|nr:haloacid dehalogenase-like hydrolase [Candidatus Aenigmarchaeota archaeon]